MFAQTTRSLFEEISTELDQQNLEGIFQSEDQKSVFMRACYGIVNGLYKREWKKHVAEEVRNNLRANQFALTDDLEMTRAHSNQTCQGLDEANEKVIHLQEELNELKQQDEILEKEIDRVQRLEHLNAEQVKALRQQIEAIERNQQIQTKEIDIVSRESTFQRDKMSTLEQAKNTDPLEKNTTIPNTHRSKPAMVQFQENIGYLRASLRMRPLSPIGFSNLRNGQTPDNTSGNRPTMDHTISNFSLRKEKMMAPTFTGDKNEKPIKFLKEMRRHLQPLESPLEELKYILSRNLKGNAAS